MDIVEFLRARLDEDEAVARLAQADPWRAEPDWTSLSVGWTLTTSTNRTVLVCNHDGLHDDGRGIGVASQFEVQHIARHDPARVLREVEAKRRIVDGYGDDDCVRDLASVYADHPDYDPEWA